MLKGIPLFFYFGIAALLWYFVPFSHVVIIVFLSACVIVGLLVFGPKLARSIYHALH